MECDICCNSYSKCGGFTTKTWRDYYKRTWSWVPDVVWKPKGLEHQRDKGLNIWYPCESEKSCMCWRSRWPGMLRWYGCKTARAAFYFVNKFSRTGKNNNEEKCGLFLARAFTSAGLDVWGWESTICPFHLCSVSGSGEWLYLCMCFLSSGVWKTLVFFIVCCCEFLKG